MRRWILIAAVALALPAALPATSSAGSRQFSIVEDDAYFLGLLPFPQDISLGAAKQFGADRVRVVLSWRRASPAPDKRKVPRGFRVADPGSSGYNWRPYDVLVDSARQHGLKVILDLSPAIPFWGSDQPKRCPHFVGGHRGLGVGCFWKPNARLFGQFATAVARRYRGRVSLYSIWNEPNLENYLYPQSRRTGSGRVDLGGKKYRQLWIAGYRGIKKGDRGMRRHVLFGETAAISAPRDTLYSALCLDRRGRPYQGRMKRLQGCSRPGKLPIAGLAVHPYNRSAVGSVFSRTTTSSSMPMGYLNRATRLLDRAARYGRIPKRRGVYVTETGFQTRPPDKHGLSFSSQARAINEADRLFYGDPRVKSTAQFELVDAPEPRSQDIFNTGLFTAQGDVKPSLAAYKMPLVVSRLSRGRVEVWGQVRPASGRVRPVVEVATSVAGPFTQLRTPLTNGAGYFRFVLRRRHAARLHYRVRWQDLASRVAVAGRRIGYRERP